MSYDAYEKTQRNIAAPRDAEYRAFVSSTRALISVAAGEADNLAEALHVNRSLWEALASDCASEDNQLPEETRARIIGLARWVGAHSRRVLRKEETLDALIDVNRIMMDGLAGKPATEDG